MRDTWHPRRRPRTGNGLAVSLWLPHAIPGSWLWTDNGCAGSLWLQRRGWSTGQVLKAPTLSWAGRPYECSWQLDLSHGEHSVAGMHTLVKQESAWSVLEWSTEDYYSVAHSPPATWWIYFLKCLGKPDSSTQEIGEERWGKQLPTFLNLQDPPSRNHEAGSTLQRTTLCTAGMRGISQVGMPLMR